MAMEIRTVMSYKGGGANGRGPEEIHVGVDTNSVYLHCYRYIIYILVYVCVCVCVCDA